MRGLIEKDQVKEFQVTVKIGLGSKSSRPEQQMAKPGKNVEIVNRQTDRLVEVLDAFAERSLPFY